MHVLHGNRLRCLWHPLYWAPTAVGMLSVSLYCSGESQGEAEKLLAPRYDSCSLLAWWQVRMDSHKDGCSIIQKSISFPRQKQPTKFARAPGYPNGLRQLQTTLDLSSVVASKHANRKASMPSVLPRQRVCVRSHSVRQSQTTLYRAFIQRIHGHF